MENFTAYNPTKLYFGKGVLDKLAETVESYGTKILLIYGKGSVKKNGSYDKTIKELNKINAHIFEYSGIKPNPVIEDVDNAAKLGIENNIDMVIGLGGGSAIDTAKIVTLCIKERCPGWDIMTNKVKPTSSLPLICILTLAATGTEMNGNAVIQNPETHEKKGYTSQLIYPTHSFLDPTYTFTVPAKQTAYGIVDLIAHTLEEYFGDGISPLSDKFVYAIIKEAMENAKKVLKFPTNYEYRANILWASTMALNGSTSFGRRTGDWGVHQLGHVLSYLFDTPHGATLSIVYPAWLRLHLSLLNNRIKELGKALFNTNTAEETIYKLEKF
ncbi:MAG: iron-containing alcohol dehydrogenase, partial [Bacteroidales bacterium]|nr:iron-containing alcohol dehydrogenase [Bacteroidales bacterium]